MAGSENTTTLLTEGTASPLFELGRWLGSVITDSRSLDVPALRSATTEAREWANDALRERIENLILTNKAATSTDAAVHALFIHYIASDIDGAIRRGDDAAAERALWTLERVARSIFDVLVDSSGIDPKVLAADFFLRPSETLWPTVKTNAWSDAVSSLNGLPLEPTSAMLAAAVRETGCTEERARAGFAAMRAAHLQEVAA